VIIRYPTGSYLSVLPQEPEDSESVVYTISNTTPPRSELNFMQIPDGIKRKQRDPKTALPSTRRFNLGDLALTSKKNRPGSIVTGNQLFYIGQVTEFVDSTVTDIGDINSALVTQHDRVYIDPTHIGLETDELDDISSEALDAQGQILIELEGLQKRKDDLQVEIVSEQKILNDANRVIGALDIIVDLDPGNVEMQALKVQTEEVAADATAAIDEAVVEINEMPAAIRAKHDKLRTLATMID